MIHKSKYAKDINPEQRYLLMKKNESVKKIDIEGNKAIAKEAILLTVPVKVGSVLNINDTSTVIKNIYKMGYFSSN